MKNIIKVIIVLVIIGGIGYYFYTSNNTQTEYKVDATSEVDQEDDIASESATTESSETSVDAQIETLESMKF